MVKKEEDMLMVARKLKEGELYICERFKRNLSVFIDLLKNNFVRDWKGI